MHPPPKPMKLAARIAHVIAIIAVSCLIWVPLAFIHVHVQDRLLWSGHHTTLAALVLQLIVAIVAIGAVIALGILIYKGLEWLNRKADWKAGF